MSEALPVKAYTEIIDGLVYFSQLDPAWKSEPYSTTGDPSQTMGLSGDVPTLQATVVRNLTPLQVDPVSLGQWNLNNRLCVPAIGTLRSSWNLLVSQLGLKQEFVTSTTEALETALTVGGFIVGSLKDARNEGLATANGHVIALRAADSQGFRVLDTQSPSNSRKAWSEKSILPFVDSKWRHIWAQPEIIMPSRLYVANALQRVIALYMRQG